ncbi:MAG: apolipoprotein N-acyltransferase [Thermoanaerobaculales bacterium]|jgi:apolipoprotein N-acyltransferase|nr:apolipoprotein N-acyltransferase [Thermoanaerobaculales bacterium]
MQRACPWILAVLAGGTLALAMPGPGLWPLAILFPVLLLEAVERSEGRWQPWLLGWVAGTVHWVVAVNWVLDVMHHYGGLPWAGALGALVGLGLYLGLIWAAVTWLLVWVPASWRIWFFPAAWIAIDGLRRFQPYQFPWNDVAAVFAHQPAILGSLPVWGASGLSWALVACGAGMWGLARCDRRPAAAALLIAAIGCTITCTAVTPRFVPSGDSRHIAVIQPGTTLEEKWDPEDWQEITDRVWTLTRRAADAGAEIVLWPESAVPFRLDADEGYQAIVSELARNLDVEIVLNSTVAVGDGYANAAHLVTPSGISAVRYDKVHLVPFGEYIPPWAALVTSDALVREVGGFTAGDQVRPLPAAVPLGVAICYEVVFASHSAAAVQAGSEILATLTNDGWYGFSWAPEQHFAQVKLRAAEQRRWFARAALTGISGFVDPYGRVTERLGVGEQGILVGALEPSTRLTPRARWGDWWAVLCAVAAVVLLAVGWIRRGSRA